MKRFAHGYNIFLGVSATLVTLGFVLLRFFPKWAWLSNLFQQSLFLWGVGLALVFGMVINALAGNYADGEFWQGHE